MAKKEKKGIVKEFKEFALQGNLFDMAVGVLIGGVFKDLVSSFTNNIIMPIIGIFTGNVNF
ncbi:MAG: MscL family protein, partial [Oscillospiraceae bacterium]|nr:MscL family protein [Oscillospiraceae bacterium]